MDIVFVMPSEVLTQIGKAAKEKRLSLNLTQQHLSLRSGVSLGALKKFEHTGKISLESLLKIALILDSLKDFTTLFKPTPPAEFLTLHHLLKQKIRKRGRK